MFCVQVTHGITQPSVMFRCCFLLLVQHTQIAKNMSSDMIDSVNRVQEAITLALSKAEKDNNTIYLQVCVSSMNDTTALIISCTAHHVWSWASLYSDGNSATCLSVSCSCWASC